MQNQNETTYKLEINNFYTIGQMKNYFSNNKEEYYFSKSFTTLSELDQTNQNVRVKVVDLLKARKGSFLSNITVTGDAINYINVFILDIDTEL